MGEYGMVNSDWKIVDWKDLELVARRSNCLLSMNKVLSRGYAVRTEEQCLREYLEWLRK